MANIGDKAPAFTLPTSDDGVFSVPSGKPLVLYFYPKDDTPGCTTEARDFTALRGEFDQLGVEIVGVSPDTTQKHDKFRTKHSLTVALAADEDKIAIEAYGVWVEKNMYGKKYMDVERSTFLIDGAGKIVEAWRKVRVKGHADAVLEAARQHFG